MGYAVSILADSLSPDGVRLTTIEVTFPRIVLAELNTHRMLSRNSASSRAIPVEKRIAMVDADPYIPDEFGSNQRGMQSGAPLDGLKAEQARSAWLYAKDAAVKQALILAELGVHKEYANRLLEPFLWHTVIVSATEWENFDNLRCHKDASRPIRLAAEMMRDARRASVPLPVGYGEWHSPLLRDDGPGLLAEGLDPRKVVIGRCARVSYLTHDGKRDPGADISLVDERLTPSGHMSPLEHSARPAQAGDIGRAEAVVGPVVSPRRGEVIAPSDVWFGNFRGWVQYRKLIPGEAVFQPSS